MNELDTSYDAGGQESGAAFTSFQTEEDSAAMKITSFFNKARDGLASIFREEEKQEDEEGEGEGESG